MVVVGGANSAGQAALHLAKYAQHGPLTAGVEDWLRCDAGGYLMTGPDLRAEADRDWWPLARDPLFLESSQPGLFVAGDVRHGSIKRVASAVGEGAMSVALVHSYLG